jgi:hypothetical protein
MLVELNLSSTPAYGFSSAIIHYNFDCSSFLSKDLEGLFDRRQDGDVFLIAGDCEHKSHKVMLKARCQYFANMFATDIRETNSGRVLSKTLDPKFWNSC